MTYDAYAALKANKKKRWLYEIRYGSTTNYYHESRDDLTIDAGAGSETWVASSITFDRFKLASAVRRQETIVIMPASDAFAQLFLASDAISSSVVIRDGFEEDADEEFKVHFRGTVIGVRATLGTIALLCKPRTGELARKGVNYPIQRPCPHAVYSPRCGVNINSFYAVASMTGLADNVATVTEASAQPDGYYRGGVFMWDGGVGVGFKEQWILGHTGTSLTLLGPIVGLAEEFASSPPVTVNIAPGCDLTRQTCNDRFSNLENNGGWAWMTGETPFDGRTIW